MPVLVALNDRSAVCWNLTAVPILNNGKYTEWSMSAAVNWRVTWSPGLTGMELGLKNCFVTITGITSALPVGSMFF